MRLSSVNFTFQSFWTWTTNYLDFPSFFKVIWAPFIGVMDTRFTFSDYLKCKISLQEPHVMEMFLTWSSAILLFVDRNSKMRYSGRPLWNICVTNDHGHVPQVVNTSWPFTHSWFITGFVTRWTRPVSLVEQELPTLPEHLSSPPVFSGVCVTWSLVLRVCFVDHCLSFCNFSFGHWLSVLRYTNSDYPIGIFKLFCRQCLFKNQAGLCQNIVFTVQWGLCKIEIGLWYHKIDFHTLKM
jgi:hypothetical protein